MNLVVDTNNIELEVKNLERSIKEYSDNSYDMFCELSKLGSYWKDNDASLFEEKINKERENFLNVTDGLEKISKVYKNILDIYDKKISLLI